MRYHKTFLNFAGVLGHQKLFTKISFHQIQIHSFTCFTHIVCANSVTFYKLFYAAILFLPVYDNFSADGGATHLPPSTLITAKCDYINSLTFLAILQQTKPPQTFISSSLLITAKMNLSR